MPTLRAVLPKGDAQTVPFVEVPLLRGSEGPNILRDWMRSKAKSLTAAQWAAVDLAIPSSCTILYIRLLFDRVSAWHSYDAPEELPSDVPGILERFYDDLEHEYGAPMMRTFMRLLLTARAGLSIEALMDLLSADDEVLGGPGKPDTVFEFHEPPVRRLPPLVLTRVKRAFGDYIVERNANGITVLGLYHRQFIEAGRRKYLPTAELRAAASLALAEYFSGDAAVRFSTRNITPQPLRHGSQPNMRRLHELPTAFLGAGLVARCAAEWYRRDSNPGLPPAIN